MRRLIALALCAAVVLTTGCVFAAQQAEEQESAYLLYFQTRDLRAAQGGDAIAAEASSLREAEGQDAQATAEALVALLLAGPADEALASPIPSGTALQSLTIDGSRAVVDFSRPYGMLSGVRLALADYCVALTLTQLPEIRTVSITVGGQELAYRTSQTFTARDVLLSSTEDVVGTVDASLYFLDASGALVAEERTLNLYEGDTQAETLLAALLAGPEDRDLASTLPEGFAIQSVWLTGDECYVNLSSTVLDTLAPEADLTVPLRAVAQSLLSLDAVHSVAFLQDGETVAEIRGTDVSHPFEG